MFIIVQKYEIGHWCPLCLSIAAMITVASISLSINFFKGLYSSIQTPKQGEIMNKIKQLITQCSFVMLGFLMAMIGIANPDSTEATTDDIKDRLAFGKKNSPVVVYFFSDWYCPSCRKIDPIIEKMYPKIRSKATVYFVDYPLHKKSMNITPFNIAFQINNKSDYFKIRTALIDLAKKSKVPTDDDIIAMSEKKGFKYKKISFMDTKTGMDFYEGLVSKYDLHSTPIMVITNINTKKQVILDGRDEITEEAALKAIDQLIK
jgi:thiol-disulfide isomerase/thioredoxin